MLPDRVSNPGPLTYETGALPIALRGSTSEKVNSGLTSHQLLGHTAMRPWLRSSHPKDGRSGRSILRRCIGSPACYPLHYHHS